MPGCCTCYASAGNFLSEGLPGIGFVFWPVERTLKRNNLLEELIGKGVIGCVYRATMCG